MNISSNKKFNQNKIILYFFLFIVYKLSMKLNEFQLSEIKKACESVDYGSVTIKMNPTLDHIDLVIDRQIRLKSEPTRPPAKVVDKKY